MRYIPTLVFALFLLTNIQSVSAYQELLIDRIDDRNINVVRVVLDGQHYVVSSLAMTGGDTLENLTTKLPGATASLNGAFFCPKDYTYCNGETTTISERVFMGNAKDYSRWRPDTGIRGVFGFDKDGEPMLAQNNMGYIEGLDENINADRMDEIFFGLGNWPVILMEGKDVVAGSEAHMDDKIKSRRTQAFICHTQYSKEVFMGTIEGTTMYEMPKFLQRNFGCYNAINLDAGASLAMTYDDKVLRRAPRRNIMDAFVVLTRDGYEVLTNHIPTEKTPYVNSHAYIMNEADHDLVDLINEKLEKIINKSFNGDIKAKRRSAVRAMLYNGFESELVQSDPRRKKIIQELILKRMVIDTL